MSKYELTEIQKKQVNKAIRYAKKFDNYPYKLCGLAPPNFNPKDQGHVAFTINSSKKVYLILK